MKTPTPLHRIIPRINFIMFIRVSQISQNWGVKKKIFWVQILDTLKPMHFSFVSILMIFGEYDHLTLPQSQQWRPKPGEYFITPIFSQKMSFFHIFFIFLIGFSNCNWLQSISEPQKPPSRPFLIENWSKKTKVMVFDSNETMDWLPCLTK